MDLFSYPPAYPEHPGSKQRGGTSEEAARRVAPHTKTLKVRILDLLRTGKQLTPDEIAAALKANVITTRARVTELKADGLLMETGRRRQNDSGHKADVVRIAR